MPPTPTDNVTIVRRFVDEILNRGRFEILAELVHDDYRYIGPDGGELVGTEALTGLLRAFHSGFPDLHARVDDAVGSGETVAMAITLTGTHDGHFEGIPPTGARLELPLAIFTRVHRGRIAEDREYYDTGTLLSQLGLADGGAGSEKGDDHDDH